MTSRRRTSMRPAAGAVAIFVAALLWVGGCAGDSAFPTLPGGSPGTGPGNGTGPRDTTRPSVQFQLPNPGFTVAVGDSVFTQVRIRDDQAIASLVLEGFALRGSAALGTQQRVDRFAAKTVEFDPETRVVRDTVITRFLLAAADAERESPILLVATVQDAAGNVAADTVRVTIGGPRVEIVSPAAGQQFRAGTQLQVTVSARDRTDQIRSLRLRLAGAVEATLVQDFPAPPDSVAVTFNYQIPASAVGEIRLTAIAESRANIQAISREVVIRAVPPTADVTPPTVRFSLQGRPRAELRDSIDILVSATDDTRVDSVGIHLQTYRLQGTTLTPLAPVLRRVPAASHRFRIGLAEILNVADTATVAIEVTAFAVDSARNCAFAVVPDRDSSARCRTDPAGTRVFPDPGARVDVFLTRGRTMGLRAGSRIADLASVGGRLFLSNITQNVVEVLQVGDSVLGTPISVGSEPWGLAIGFGGTSLYVANSGGTNISVVPLTGGNGLRESRRIRTSDIRLYDVAYDVVTDTVNVVTEIDYSDRPQFLAQTSQGQLLYSTKPTETRADGTVRIYDPARDTTYGFNRGSEIFVGYAGRAQGRAIVVNPLDAGKATGGRLVVCPRRLTPAQADPNCLIGSVSVVSAQLAEMRLANLTDTRVDLNRDARTIGLSDTTFVAVSGDHSTVAFGEGVVQFGRIMRFEVTPGGLVGTTTQTQDLLGNAAERVIGLALNQDGTLGVARGGQVYLWDTVLRLQGIVQSGSPSGGAAVHPANRDYPNPATGSRLAFASGLDAQGHPYVDVLDAYSFRTVRRIPLRDPVVGAVIAVPVAPGTPGAGTVAVRIFAITSGGVVQIDLAASDLVP